MREPADLELWRDAEAVYRERLHGPAWACSLSPGAQLATLLAVAAEPDNSPVGLAIAGAIADLAEIASRLMEDRILLAAAIDLAAGIPFRPALRDWLIRRCGGGPVYPLEARVLLLAPAAAFTAAWVDGIERQGALWADPPLRWAVELLAAADSFPRGKP